VICHAKLTQISFIKAKKNLFGAAKSPSFLYSQIIGAAAAAPAAPLSTPLDISSEEGRTHGMF